MITFIEVGLLLGNFDNNKEEFEKIILGSLESKIFVKNSIIYIPSKKFQFLNGFEGSVYCISIDDIAEKFDQKNVQFFYYEFSEILEPESELIEADEQQITSSMYVNKNLIFLSFL